MTRMLVCLGTPTLNLLGPRPSPLKHKLLRHDVEDDENDIDMSAILNPKLSSTRIERPRRVPVPVSASPRPTTNDPPAYRGVSDPIRPKQIAAPAAVAAKNPAKDERPHSDIIEKVLAGIPLTDSEIRKVIHRKK